MILDGWVAIAGRLLVLESNQRSVSVPEVLSQSILHALSPGRQLAEPDRPRKKEYHSFFVDEARSFDIAKSCMKERVDMVVVPLPVGEIFVGVSGIGADRGAIAMSEDHSHELQAVVVGLVGDGERS